MKIEHFGGLKTEQGFTYFYEPTRHADADDRIALLSNQQAQVLLHAYHRRSPLKNSFDRERYGSFADRDADTQAELVSHIFAGPLRPLQIEPFHVSEGCVGYTRHGFRALTNAMVTMGLPIIPIQILDVELPALENVIGTSITTIPADLFLEQRGKKFGAIQQSFTPAQFSYMNNFPHKNVNHSEVRRAAEASLFLLEHQSEADEKLPWLMRNYGLRGQHADRALANAAEHRKIYDRDNQQLYAATLVGTLYAADRQGIHIEYDKAEELHRWDVHAVKAWSQATLAQPGRPLLSIALAAAIAHQQSFIDGLPAATVCTESTKQSLRFELDKFRHDRKHKPANPSPA